MEKIYSGKTKDVFLLKDGNILLRFKDTVTGANGKIDPGANRIIGEVKGKGNASLRMTIHFFELLKDSGLTTHYVGCGEEFGYDPGTIVVGRAKLFNLEVICREKAWGSFVRRYGEYISEGTRLPSVVEFTLKDDKRGDPLITEDALVALAIANREEVTHMKDTARKATKIIKDHLAEKGLELIDIKYEFGKVEGKIVIIDEISGDGMRVAKDGQILLQKELCAAVLG